MWILSAMAATAAASQVAGPATPSGGLPLHCCMYSFEFGLAFVFLLLAYLLAHRPFLALNRLKQKKQLPQTPPGKA